MSDNRFSAASVPTHTPTADSSTVARPSIRARLLARLNAGKLDAMLAVGAPTPAGSPIAVRAARLTSIAEREELARVLHEIVEQAKADVNVWSVRVPLHYTNVAAAEDVIAAIRLRLHAPLPVSARGMARLNRVLTDGCGPLYEDGRGDLAGRLGAALAAM
ncbi:hypothetical protein [Mycolicibacterium brisbanense]|uniref:Uncharacterized protein n=1 Tax=Mycolicibacterium brisbanense TaxID=146020 RepID=A0A100VWI2_9MYCO|nr:hypothetical protein [Mycolicibacterium brisbanense]MCV7162312.1 hypothetical protein [Mycolicibacterium brisbanense]GAS87238.1 uncharacterized protein, precursor [Mycolicibacterium brisbanense]